MPGSGDTFWVQSITAPAASAGSQVRLNDTAPTADQWNLAAVEIVRGNRQDDADDHVGGAGEHH